MFACADVDRVCRPMHSDIANVLRGTVVHHWAKCGTVIVCVPQTARSIAHIKFMWCVGVHIEIGYSATHYTGANIGQWKLGNQRVTQ